MITIEVLLECEYTKTLVFNKEKYTWIFDSNNEMIAFYILNDEIVS